MTVKRENRPRSSAIVSAGAPLWHPNSRGAPPLSPACDVIVLSSHSSVQFDIYLSSIYLSNQLTCQGLNFLLLWFVKSQYNSLIANTCWKWHYSVMYGYIYQIFVILLCETTLWLIDFIDCPCGFFRQHSKRVVMNFWMLGAFCRKAALIFQCRVVVRVRVRGIIE